MDFKEARQVIIDMCDALQIFPGSRQGKAMFMAIKCLEAWDEITQEISRRAEPEAEDE